MNNKGITIIELITTFALSSFIIFFLINIVIVLKETYTKNDLRTQLLIKESNLSKALNSDFRQDNLSSYVSCDEGLFCYTFNFSDFHTSSLIITEDTITYGNFVYKLDSQSIITDYNITKETIDNINVNLNNSFLKIKITISNKLYKNIDFGVNLIYPYNSNEITL